MKIETKFNLISIMLLLLLVIASVFSYSTLYHERLTANKIILCFTGYIIFIVISYSICVRMSIINPLKKVHRSSSSIISEERLDRRIEVKTGDEIGELAENFNKLTSSLQERIALLKTASEKEQHVIRSLAMLNEMMGFITSELKSEAILQRFLEMTRNLLKAEHSGIFIFEGETKELKFFKSTINSESEALLDCAKAMIKSPMGDAIRTITPMRINKFLVELPLRHLAIKNLLAVPVTSTDNKMAALIITVNREGGFTQDDEDRFLNFAFQAFHAIMIHEELARLAVTDGITGLSNHRAFQEKLSDEMNRAQRYSKLLSLIMIDIDNFKSFNDSYGHQTGDKALKEIAKIISSRIRNVDFPARYGGEEFIIILPETGCDDAAAIANRIRLKVIEQPFFTEGGENVKLTISAGVVCCHPFAAKSADEANQADSKGKACYLTEDVQKKDLIKKADQALYYAKSHGRNRVCTYQEMVSDFLKEIPQDIDNILKDPALKGLELIAQAIDKKSNYTKDHSIEIATFAMMLGKQIKLDTAQVESLRIASILHDVGNVTIPDYILNKPGPLTPEEKSIIQGHPLLAEMVLKKYPHIENVLPVILYHHERFDGKGYPLGLKAEEIPLLARILAVVESYHAMISPRPYRGKMTKEAAMEELKKEAGTQFDPMVVNMFFHLLKQMAGNPSEK